MSILTDFLDKLVALIDPPLTMAQLADKLDAMAVANPEKLDWRGSIVDLMKLTGANSGLEERKSMAADLDYLGPLDGSAEMNNWLHERVMARLAEKLKYA